MKRLHLLVSLLACVTLAWLSGCSGETGPGGTKSAGMRLRVLFPDKSTPEAGSVNAVRAVRAFAFELAGPQQTPVLRDSAAAVLPPGERRFHLELQVPPADLYRVQVLAMGTLESPGRATEDGVVFFGSERVPALSAGSTRTIEILMRDIVPELSAEGEPGGVRLSWTPIDSVRTYRLKETSPPPGTPTETATLRTDTLISFPPGRGPSLPLRVNFRVRAELLAGPIGAYSESLGVFEPEPTAPAPILDLTVSAAGPESVRLEWTATGDDGVTGQAAQYDLRRSDSPIATEAEFDAALRIEGLSAPQPAGTHEVFTVTGLSPDTRYFFALEAADEVPLWSALSNSVAGSTLPLPPAAPTDLVATATSATEIHLSWLDQASNESLYAIERRGPQDPAFVRVRELSGQFDGRVEFDDAGLLGRSRYLYRVRAENAGGASPYSNVADLRTLPPPPLDFAAEAIGPDSVRLTWSYPAPPPSVGFSLERQDPGTDFSVIGQPGPLVREFLDGGRTPRARYFYRMRAIDEAPSPYSPADTVDMPDRPPLCRLTPSPLRFDSVEVGSASEKTFVIENLGGGLLTGDIAAGCGPFQVLSGGGPFQIAGGASRSVRVRFEPAAGGDFSCDLSMGSAECSLLTCIGVGVPPPLCSVEPTALDFGVTLIGGWSDRSFSVTNRGGGLLSGEVALTGAAFSVIEGSRPFVLRAGQSWQVTVRFQPSVPGVAEVEITLGHPLCGAVAGSGIGQLPGICAAEPDTLEFGSVPIGEAAQRTFTLTNLGGAPLLCNVPPEPCSGFTVVSGVGAFQLMPQESRRITVRFQPAQEGPATCLIPLGPEGCAVWNMGTGLPAPICEVAPPSLNFGNVALGDSASRSFTITNTGGGVLSGFVKALCTDFSVDAGGGAFNLGTGQSHSVTVRFRPSVPGPATCAVLLGTTACPDVPCSGNGIPSPACDLEPDTLQFGVVTVGGAGSATCRLTNAGEGTVQYSVPLQPCAQFTVYAGGGTFFLRPEQWREITVLFQPTQAGPASCSIPLGPYGCAIECLGIGEPAPVCSLSTDELRFGTVPVGSTADSSFTITNSGGGLLAGEVSLGDCSVFSLVAGAGAFSLAAGQTRTVTVRFSPEVPGPAACPIYTGSQYCSGLTCSGTGEAAPRCEVAPPDLLYGVLQEGETASLPFTLRNIGGGLLSGTVTFTDCLHFLLPGGSQDYALGAGESREFTVSYQPVGTGAHACSLSTGTGCKVYCGGTATPSDGRWWDGFLAQGLNGEVRSMASMGSALAVCGSFDVGGGVPMNRVGLWDGSGWASPPPHGLGSVDRVASYGGVLVIAGWTGESDNRVYLQTEGWGQLGGSFDGTVRCLIEIQGTLYAAGSFLIVGDFYKPGVVYWGDGDWQELGSGYLDQGVNRLIWYNGSLYAAVLPGEGGGGLAQYVDGSWVSVISDTDLEALAVYNGELYVGGNFLSIGSVAANSVARYDGTSWKPVGSGVNGSVVDLIPYDGKLVALGYFNSAGGLPAGNIAEWDGTMWLPLGSGLSGGDASYRTLAVYGGDLYAGGLFESAGGKPSYNIARWTGSAAPRQRAGTGRENRP